MTMYIAIPLKYLDEECEIHTLYIYSTMYVQFKMEDWPVFT